MHDRLVSRRIDALHQCFLVISLCASSVRFMHIIKSLKRTYLFLLMLSAEGMWVGEKQKEDKRALASEAPAF